MKALDQDGLDYVVDKIYDLVNSGGSADYIVEEGQSGIWTYRKWASGVAECWGKVTVALSGTGTLWKAPIYAYLGVSAQNYPFEFYEVPTETASVSQAVNAVWLYKQASAEMNNTKTKSATYALIKVDAFDNNATAVISYHVKGLWKEFTPSVSAKAQRGLEDFTSSVTVNTTYYNIVSASAIRFGNLGFLRYRLTVKSNFSDAMSKPIVTLPHKIAGHLTNMLFYFRSSTSLTARPLLSGVNNQVFQNLASTLQNGDIIEFTMTYVIAD